MPSDLACLSTIMEQAIKNYFVDQCPRVFPVCKLDSAVSMALGLQAAAISLNEVPIIGQPCFSLFQAEPIIQILHPIAVFKLLREIFLFSEWQKTLSTDFPPFATPAFHTFAVKRLPTDVLYPRHGFPRWWKKKPIIATSPVRPFMYFAVQSATFPHANITRRYSAIIQMSL